MTTAVAEKKPTIYDEIIANIKADPKAWCQGDYETRDGDSISACLVGHVDLALKTAYVVEMPERDTWGDVIEGTGKVFVSKDKRKWARRHRIVAHLATLITGNEVQPGETRAANVHNPVGDDTFRAGSEGEGEVTDWNDDYGQHTWNRDEDKMVQLKPGRKRGDVLRLARKAAKQFPND